MIGPYCDAGIPTVTCDGRMLSKRDVGRWVVRTMPNNTGTDWSFTVRGSTIEEWKNQVVKVVAIKRSQVEVEDKRGQRHFLDEELSNDKGWLTLEELIEKKNISYIQAPYSTFISNTKRLDEGDVGKEFVRTTRFGLMDTSFMPVVYTSGKINLHAIKVLDFKPNKITALSDGLKITLKDEYARAGGWVEAKDFMKAIEQNGIKVSLL